MSIGELKEIISLLDDDAEVKVEDYFRGFSTIEFDDYYCGQLLFKLVWKNED